ncbi:hypothetical protein [Nocardia sp. NPDC052566]|uniref:hypothetical protein n=1 Tax=Nocardia sp. NPDC052566 TaxID=3364330 RepID=UPI0037C7B6BE
MHQPPFPPASYPPGRVPPQRVKPSGWWYGFGALLIAFGLVGGVALGVLSAFQAVNEIFDLQRTPVPSQRTMRFDRAGAYTLYYEYPGAAEGAPPPSTVVVRITTWDGTVLPLAPVDEHDSYHSGGYEGRAERTIQVTQPGNHIVTVEGRAGVTLAVGRGDMRGEFRWFVIAICLGIAGPILGIVVLVVVGLWRRANRAKLHRYSFSPR